MNSELIYRTGNSEDFQALKELGLISYSQHKQSLSPDNWEIMQTNLQNEERLKSLIAISKFFVCQDAGSIVGQAFFVPNGNPTPIFEKDWSYIRMVGVHPAHSGKGIAKRLTHMCIAHAKEQGEKLIALHTSEYMDAARHIYESMGFIKVKEIDPIFGKRYWLYHLHL